MGKCPNVCAGNCVCAFVWRVPIRLMHKVYSLLLIVVIPSYASTVVSGSVFPGRPPGDRLRGIPKRPESSTFPAAETRLSGLGISASALPASSVSASSIASAGKSGSGKSSPDASASHVSDSEAGMSKTSTSKAAASDAAKETQQTLADTLAQQSSVDRPTAGNSRVPPAWPNRFLLRRPTLTLGQTLSLGGFNTPLVTARPAVPSIDVPIPAGPPLYTRLSGVQFRPKAPLSGAVSGLKPDDSASRATASTVGPLEASSATSTKDEVKPKSSVVQTGVEKDVSKSTEKGRRLHPEESIVIIPTVRRVSKC